MGLPPCWSWSWWWAWVFSKIILVFVRIKRCFCWMRNGQDQKNQKQRNPRRWKLCVFEHWWNPENQSVKPGSATKVLQSKGQRWSVATIDGGVPPVAAMTLSGTLILVLQFTDALRFYMVTRIMKTVVFLLHWPPKPPLLASWPRLCT